ncbi:cofactor-independent phosphoglycerate mutase [Desulfopila inferna]|uniref:cofactor-independent phosphoglycerate mutase n=1 Tax=Desulfopila inferna TaxID=468528 RepID=UPI0019663349|nr:cofactor-independent phosphoglycerate mutase [Desulfopila inferna]MBM9603452.1 cofactor-independent phosphoglycerate mutase [Desulfopila inferna]
MKYLILVGDGMGDFPLAELGNATPLEAAATPAMDEICRKGELFRTKTIPEGYAPGSDVANLSLMGYDPAKYYTGRAPLEAASMGIALAPDETAFRCNLVTLAFESEKVIDMVDFTGGHISTAEAGELIAALEEECGGDLFHFFAGVSYRHLLTFRGDLPGLATVPPHDYIEQNIFRFRNNYLRHHSWADLLSKAEKVLAQHPVNRKRLANSQLPANSIWLWGEGKMPQMPTFRERFNIQGSMISAVDLLKGIGVNAGLRIIDVPGATGFLDTNYRGKAEAALEALQSQDFVFVHLEAPDESGHQGSIKNKLQAIEDFDSKIVGYIIEALHHKGVDFRVSVTTDHYTPIALRTHTIDPVPTLLYDSRHTENGCGLSFSERSAQSKNIRLLENGHELINTLLQQPCNSK